jgi:hypothetical protein
VIRGRFEADHDGSLFVVDASYLDTDERIRLYRDGRLVDVANRRARWDIGAGTRIEAAVARVGMKYVRLARAGSRDKEPLRPAAGTPEAWRARLEREHPRESRLLGVAAVTVLLVVLAIEIPQLINLLGLWLDFRVPALTLPGWANTTLALIAGTAALERSLSMKHNPWLDD